MQRALAVLIVACLVGIGLLEIELRNIRVSGESKKVIDPELQPALLDLLSRRFTHTDEAAFLAQGSCTQLLAATGAWKTLLLYSRGQQTRTMHERLSESCMHTFWVTCAFAS